MASILIVDDRPINREFLATLLGYFNYAILQAANGAEALALAGARRPDLIITDVLMPVMDGVELVRRLRADPALAATPVIFYTATYLLGDARQMAQSCGVDTVIGKPASPQTILDAVTAKLARPGTGKSPLSAALAGLPGVKIATWLTQKALAGKPPAGALQPALQAATTLSLRLAALLELGLEMAAERDLERLLQHFIRAAGDIMKAQYGATGIVEAGKRIEHVAVHGTSSGLHALLRPAEEADALLERVRDGKAGIRHLSGPAAADALPAGHPPVRELLLLAVRSPTNLYGWLYFADPPAGSSFNEEDEQLATILATRLAIACENLRLFRETRCYASELEIEVAARRESEARFREIAENIREVFWLTDPAFSQVLYVSPGYEALWGRRCDSLYADGSAWRAGVHPDDLAAVEEALSWLPESGQFDRQFRLLRPDGSLRWVRARGFPIRDEQGMLRRVASLIEDITELKQQQDRVARLNRVLAVLSGINSAIVRIRLRPALYEEACRIAVEDGQFALAWIGRLEDGQLLTPLAWRSGEPSMPPPQATAVVRPDGDDEGDSDGTVLGSGHVEVCNDLQRFCPEDPCLADTAAPPRLRSRAILSLRENGVAVGAMVLYAAEAGFFDQEEIRLLDELAGDISFALDYIAREERLNYLAYYDALTGLPNRSLFIDRVTQLVHGASHDSRGVAVILLNIDHFKLINDSHGRHVADALLKQIGERLFGALGESCSLARIGGDIFAVAMGDLAAGDNAMTVLREGIVAPLSAPFPTLAGIVQISVRAGLALYPGDGERAEVLFSHAESALAEARASGARYSYFDPELNARSVAKLALERELRRAVELGQFEVYFQPKISLQSGGIIGAEALVRWRHPDKGLIGPTSFIPLAEESGLIMPIGEWVLNSVCEQQARWQAAGLDIVPVAVNLSAAQFRNVRVVDMVRDALTAAGLDPRYLELELTESLLMHDPDGQVATLGALRELGVALSLDDFGTGYSSLAYLKRYPFNNVKIDRAFIVDITQTPEDAAIADATISIARRLAMKTIAEGVESPGQLDYLRQQGCDVLQGYLFSRPVPAEAFEAMLRNHTHLELPPLA